ncbi:NAD(P)/FAD-dependent oxidoreductase [Synechococcus sp. PCC 7336]|uniref:NAD(P)/FAD-dependent oxidoreductase n=1 Tax=Synechococcus sp. PCC 7336 TaxID=195250 RepID=UPI00036B3BBF|nr:NAD(P)/FAD-dependent oxidoreductase [Synechococcus sp. PCC 7336]
MTKTIAIVGAGLAGLTCAKVLQENGCNDFVLLEQSDRAGGRVRTDEVNGFQLDRGFQVLFSAYPAVRRHLDLEALELCNYSPGAVLVRGDRHYPIGDPLRAPATLLESLANPLLTLGDKARILTLRAQLFASSIEAIWQQPDLSTLDFLQQWGFSPQILQHFFYPFYSGIFLDPELKTSARLFQFYFKMLSEGAIATPKRGMGAISDQLASHLASGQLRCNATVERIAIEGERVTGVQLRDGSTLAAEFVVCATEATAAARLVPRLNGDRPIPTTPRAVTCLYFSTPISAHAETAIHLNSAKTPETAIHHCIQLSNVSPALTPVGQHLLSVTVLGNPPSTPDRLAERCRQELLDWFPHLDGDRLSYLRQYRIPFAQFDQPPGLHDRLPSPRSAMAGLVLAGEYTCQSSIEGAMQSGDRAANSLLEQL